MIHEGKGLCWMIHEGKEAAWTNSCRPSMNAESTRRGIRGRGRTASIFFTDYIHTRNNTSTSLVTKLYI